MPNSLNMIPQLDLSNLRTADPCAMAVEVRKATASCGFFYVYLGNDHANTIASVRREQRSFFALPVAEKNKIAIDQNNRGYLAQGMARMNGANRHDQKEVFFWGREAGASDPDVIAGLPLCGANQWPDLPGFRECIECYSDMVGQVGDKLLQIIAHALGAEADFFTRYYSRCMLRGQLLCYPTTDNHPDQFGVAPHSDFGCITVLLQESPGLEVLLPDGDWLPIEPRPGTVVINIGDLLQRWSNNHMPSTMHRVRNKNNEARYSIAMFYDPNPAAVIDPADLLPVEAPKYPPVKAADYILGRNKGVFRHYRA